MPAKCIFKMKPILYILVFFFYFSAKSQSLKPCFDPQESEDLLKLNFAFLDTVRSNPFKEFLEGYNIHYRTPAVGLDNSCDVWLRKDGTVVMMLRGTTANMQSFLADFYCAMIPASGTVQLSGNKKFDYKLAEDPRAAVHAGFLIGFVYLADNLKPLLDELYSKGHRNFLVAGHSQGGALCYYFGAWLHYLEKAGRYKDIVVKTYASAAPKMGNMYFAYDYDNANLSQWSYSIVNTLDPVPEMPFTTQQVDVDMNEPNPILNLMQRFDDMPLLKRIVLKSAFNKMRKRARKSSEAYQKYLGKYVGNFIHQSLAGIQLPPTVPSTYFVRPGVPITLTAHQPYLDYYKDAPKYFHHGVDPYRFLLHQYYKNLPVFKEMTDNP